MEILAPVYKVPYTKLLTVALFLLVTIWEQPKYPRIREQLNKLWKVHIIQQYKAIKRNELYTYVTR